MTIVDVHCHTFNADDLPVRGFVHHLHLRDRLIGGLLARLVDRVVQGAAPGFEADQRRLRGLLGVDGGLESIAAEPPSAAEVEAAVDDVLAELERTEPELVEQLDAEMAVEDRAAPAPEPGLEGLVDRAAGARRAVAWAMLYRRSRVDLVTEFDRTFGGAVDLMIPMLVDLGTGLGDPAETTRQEQIELFDLLSQASMRGRLPQVDGTQLHPFVGFDPLRELAARRAGAAETPLEVVQRAVERSGFVGVKVYPPMGWRPAGNEPRDGLTAADARLLDTIVDDLVGWCEHAQVPITAHGNDSNHADPGFQGFGGPQDWLAVLRRHPDLHLNLGHFGGARRGEPDDGWPWQIARAAAEAPNLYADVGNHPIYDQDLAHEYGALLGRIFGDATAGVMADRLMYGSDWFMVALHPQHDRFLERYRALIRDRFDQARADRFMGGNALSFLGFDDPANANAQRVLARYREFAPNAVPDWLAHNDSTNAGRDQLVSARTSARPDTEELPMATHPFENLTDDDVVLDTLPDDVTATIESRDAIIASLPPSSGGLEFIVADLQRWTPGRPVRVAFLDGDTALHRDVADATRQITDACNLELDFGVDEHTGEFRRWTEQDTEHAADIRVSFDQSGFWSLVGTDSSDPMIGPPGSKVGGKPGQRSLNLGGFTVTRPHDWQGVVRHEFLHALAFKHAHQNMRGPCQEDFRWEDDDGYVKTQDEHGRFVPDANGKRPGIYTYLGGFPNFWSRAKVDHNLRTADEQTSVTGRFDSASVMLYRFASFFYKTDPSPCAPTGDGVELSEEDKRGLRLLYPLTGPELEDLAARRRDLQTVTAGAPAGAGLESMTEATGVPAGAVTRRIDQVLAESLEHLPGG